MCVCTSPFAVRGLFVEPYQIPSGAMQPALLIGDQMLVDKRPFVRRQIRRGDVVVFEYPLDRRKDYVKRVVGLPGDSIGVVGGRLIINGEETAVEELGEIDIDSEGCLSRRVQIQKESTGDAAYSIVRVPDLPASLDGYWIVPDGELFVMGDNRDNSADSRTGFTVPLDHVKGKAARIHFSWDSCRSTLRSDRFWLEVR